MVAEGGRAHRSAGSAESLIGESERHGVRGAVQVGSPHPLSIAAFIRSASSSHPRLSRSIGMLD